MKIKKGMIILIMVFMVFGLAPNKTFATNDYQVIDSVQVAAKKTKKTKTKKATKTSSPNQNSGGSGSDEAAPTIDGITTGMSSVGTVTASGKIVNIINAVIKLIQIAGSGIAVIVVTMLGVKYMLASAGEKAEIKKQAMPVVIGCVILFAAVNLVAIVAGIGANL